MTNDFEETCANCKYNYYPTSCEPCSDCNHWNSYSKSNLFEADDSIIKYDECTHINEYDSVNNPYHYNQGMECIEEMVAVFGEDVVADFCLCNVWKYRKRAIYKNGTEDIEKSDWYMNKYMELKGRGLY